MKVFASVGLAYLTLASAYLLQPSMNFRDMHFTSTEQKLSCTPQRSAFGTLPQRNALLLQTRNTRLRRRCSLQDRSSIGFQVEKYDYENVTLFLQGWGNGRKKKLAANAKTIRSGAMLCGMPAESLSRIYKRGDEQLGKELYDYLHTVEVTALTTCKRNFIRSFSLSFLHRRVSEQISSSGRMV
mmetsp:Transcript_26675/g.55363  ORF Transcript_26675/g.55363 Transcript_26675/m.55363 type:complete len:184 (-) Transcript_26675:2744-3295(-)